ncbi:MAG: hypothetical protein IJ523_05740 [Succinivibrionaceae bacterium]|nr:hypothetical protein [Succinivibrionaceae bacterium]
MEILIGMFVGGALLFYVAGWLIDKIPEWKDGFNQLCIEADEKRAREDAERARQQKLDEDYKRAVIETNEREKRNRF